MTIIYVNKYYDQLFSLLYTFLINWLTFYLKKIFVFYQSTQWSNQDLGLMRSEQSNYKFEGPQSKIYKLKGSNVKPKFQLKILLS